jgi:hypothetical protein
MDSDMVKKLLFTLIYIVPACVLGQKKVLNPESFNAIDVFGPFKVELIKSDKNRIELNYKDVDSDDVVAEVSRNTLKLKLRNRHYVNDWDSEKAWDDYIQVKVYYTDLDAINAQAGAIVLTGGQLKSKNLAIESSMGAEVSLDVLSKNLYLKSTMGAVARLSGNTEYLEVKSSMGGVIKAAQLKSKTAYIKANMGAEVFVFVTDEIEVAAGLGAVVDYLGNPGVRLTSTNLGAEVRGRQQ